MPDTLTPMRVIGRLEPPAFRAEDFPGFTEAQIIAGLTVPAVLITEAYRPAPYLSQPAATHRQKAHRLARRLGCSLSYYRSRHAKHVDITLPDGMKMAGTQDVDALHHECELDEDIWPGVLDELQGLEVEPIDDAGQVP